MESYGKRRTRILKEKAFTKLGNACKRCEFNDIRALQIDHMNNDGAVDWGKMGPNSRYMQVLNDANNRFQILCANCNWIKRHEEKEQLGRRWPTDYVPKLLATDNQIAAKSH